MTRRALTLCALLTFSRVVIAGECDLGAVRVTPDGVAVTRVRAALSKDGLTGSNIWRRNERTKMYLRIRHDVTY